MQVVHVHSGDEPNALKRQWDEWQSDPAHKATCCDPELVILESPYRAVVNPIVRHVFQLEQSHPDRQIAVVIADLVEPHWFQKLLHNQRGRVLTTLLTRDSERRIVVVNVPWYFKQEAPSPVAK